MLTSQGNRDHVSSEIRHVERVHSLVERHRRRPSQAVGEHRRRLVRRGETQNESWTVEERSDRRILQYEILKAVVIVTVPPSIVRFIVFVDRQDADGGFEPGQERRLTAVQEDLRDRGRSRGERRTAEEGDQQPTTSVSDASRNRFFEGASNGWRQRIRDVRELSEFPECTGWDVDLPDGVLTSVGHVQLVPDPH